MIQIHHARGDELRLTEALWSETFGDGPELQREFSRLCCALEGPLVLLEDGGLRSMLALPQVFLILADGRTLRAGMVYALATAPEHRGQGYAAMLIETAAGLAGNRGFDCLLVMPAQPPLFQYYARRGFRPGFYVREEVVPPAPSPDPASPAAPEDYAALREKLLAGTAHTAYTSGQLTFQQLLCPETNSGLYRLELAHGPGCAAVENWADGPVVKELLCVPEDMAQGAAACAALCGAPAKVRVPAGAENGRPFAAVRWLEGAPSSLRGMPLEGWLGLAFD